MSQSRLLVLGLALMAAGTALYAVEAQSATVQTVEVAAIPAESLGYTCPWDNGKDCKSIGCADRPSIHVATDCNDGCTMDMSEQCWDEFASQWCKDVGTTDQGYFPC